MLVQRGGLKVRLSGDEDDASEPNELDDAWDELRASAYRHEYETVQNALKTQCYKSSWHKSYRDFDD